MRKAGGQVLERVDNDRNVCCRELVRDHPSLIGADNDQIEVWVFRFKIHDQAQVAGAAGSDYHQLLSADSAAKGLSVGAGQRVAFIMRHEPRRITARISESAAQGRPGGGPRAASQSGAANLASPLPHLDRVSGYGMRIHPVHGDQRMHHGIDLDAPAGTPVAAISDGIVTFAGERGGYGNLVVIDHGGGFETRYAHQEHLSVTEGDLVRAGDVLGAVGSTGVSTGPHLHFEVRRDGESVDPEPWLRAL